MNKLKIRIPKYKTDKEANNFLKKLVLGLDNFFLSDKPKIKKKIEKKLQTQFDRSQVYMKS